MKFFADHNFYPRAPRRIARRSGGFTLIELLVSIALFSVVVLIVAGAISSIINVNKKAQTITSVVNNLNFTLESMTRAIKTGGDLTVGGVSGDGCASSVSVIDSQGRTVTYEHLPVSAERENGAITIAVSTVLDGEQSPLTAPEISVEELRFCRLAGEQPAVLFVARGAMELAGGISSEFHVQSTVAQRALNLPTN